MGRLCEGWRGVGVSRKLRSRNRARWLAGAACSLAVKALPLRRLRARRSLPRLPRPFRPALAVATLLCLITASPDPSVGLARSPASSNHLHHNKAPSRSLGDPAHLTPLDSECSGHSDQWQAAARRDESPSCFERGCGELDRAGARPPARRASSVHAGAAQCGPVVVGSAVEVAKRPAQRAAPGTGRTDVLARWRRPVAVRGAPARGPQPARSCAAATAGAGPRPGAAAQRQKQRAVAAMRRTHALV